MAKIKKAKSENDGNFPEKYYKLLASSGVMDEMDKAPEDELKKIIVDCETTIEEVEQEKDADAKLKVAKEDLKTLNGGYKETIKFQTARVKYALYCLEKAGKL